MGWMNQIFLIFSLGVSDVFPISATHGRVSQLINNLSTFLINDADSDEFSSFSSTRIAVIGRPNVGKSTLVNRMLGEERVVVYDHPGTTRDSIYINYSRVEKMILQKIICSSIPLG